MTLRNLVLSLLLVLLSSRQAKAQQSEPGIDGRLLQTGIDTFAVSYSGTLIGHGITHRSRMTTGDSVQLLQVYTWRDTRGGWIIDSLFAHQRSLQTIREVRVTRDTVFEVRYLPQGIATTIRQPDGSEPRQSLASGADAVSSATLEAIAAASPLSPDFEQEYRFFYAPPSPRGIVPIRLQVRGSERVIDRSGAARDAWIVSANTPGGGTTFWIDKATRSVLKFDTREGPATIEFRR